MGDGLVTVCVLILFLVLVLVSAFIYAFPMGMVLNYNTGLIVSRNLSIWPTFATLLCRFVKEKEESFRSTALQSNKNHAAKMHVDGNSYAPNRINASTVFHITFSLPQTSCVC